MAGVQQGDPLGPLLFSLVLHPLALKIEAEFPNLDLCVWYLDDGTIIGSVADVHKVFELIQKEGPARGLHLNVKKNEIWWPSRAVPDPFPVDVDRVDNAGVKLLGAPIGSKEFTTDFVKKKLKALDDVCKLLREVDNAQVEFGLFRGCLSYNKINHLLRTCPPGLLQEALVKFDDHFQNMIAEILRVPCLTEDQWEQASLPVKLAGLGVNQTKVIAGPAYVGSCCLTKDLVAALLKQDSSSFEPSDVKGLLAAHEAATGITHELAALSDTKKVQQLLSSERHEATFKRLKSKLGVRSHNLMLACSMPHASDWLIAPPIPGLGLSLQSDAFRTALKFRLSMPLFDKPGLCPAVSSGSGSVCGAQMDVFGDHALCCLYTPSLVFRHNNIRDILGHSARAAGLAAVVIEKKNQIDGSKAKPGDITVQQYHRGFASSAFDITITHPLQKKFIEIAMEEAGVVAEEAHDRKLLKSLEVCQKEGIHFVPLAWESTGGATETVHETVRKWTELEGARGGYPAYLIRRNLYAQISCCLQRHLAQAVIDRRLELACGRVL
jgi:ubiquitin carboxyl-terminal hydrolase 44/49